MELELAVRIAIWSSRCMHAAGRREGGREGARCCSSSRRYVRKHLVHGGDR